nr:reverse transcriptase domain-containing protein [Tanacetum cinerariifolium]
MYVDGGSASEILYEHCFSQLRPEIRNQLVPATTHLIGFSGEIIWPIEKIQLLITIGDEEHSTSGWMNFVVVSSRNAETPGRRRSHYSKEQQDDPTRMRDGLRIRREPSGYQANIKRKNQGQPGYFFLKARGYDRRPKTYCRTSLESVRGMLCGYTEEKRHDDSWRMCLDFKDLNKACPKDECPLPEIDWKRLMDKAFHKQIGRNLEVYVDDLVIKSRTEDEIVRDIEETFKTLTKINMKLNPKKCTFGVEKGTFLGYKVSTRGPKVFLNEVDVVLCLPSPKRLKDVHNLNGKLASLNRFLAKLAEKSLPFFRTLKKCTKESNFHWTAKAEEAFKQIKQLIDELPMLVGPMEKEELIIYLEAAKEIANFKQIMWREKYMKGLAACTQRSAKIGMPTLRTTEVDLVQNNKALEINLDLLEEKREQAAIREAKSKAKMENYYNSKVLSASFKPGDLVYRTMMQATRKTQRS